MKTRLIYSAIIILHLMIQGTGCELSGQAGPDSTAFKYFDKGRGFYRGQVYDSSLHYFLKAAYLFHEENITFKYLESLNEVASVYSYINRINLADSILNEVISTSHKAGKDSSVLLIRAYQLKGNVRADNSSYGAAIEYMRKALALSVNYYGEDHIKTSSANGNLGIAYSMAGQYQKAIFHCNKASDIIRKQFGEDHPNVASGYNTIGNIYIDIGKLDSAQIMHEKALSIRLKILGQNHTSTAASYSNLSAVYYKKGDFQQALTYEKSVYNIRKVIYGENHPLTALCYNNFGATYEATGNYDKALESHLKSLSIRKLTLPPGHPDFAMSYINIANVYNHFNEFNKALDYNEMALEIRMKLFGKTSLETTQVINNIGDVYFRMGDNSRAIEYFSEAINDLKSAFDNYFHPELSAYENNLAECYLALRQPDSSLVHVESALKINRRLINGPGGEVDTLVFYQDEYLNSLAIKSRITYLYYQGNPVDISKLKKSVDEYNDAIDYMSVVRNSFTGDESRFFLSDKNNILFDEAINTLYNLHRVENNTSSLNRMYQMMEKSKYGIMRQQLTEKKALQLSGIPDSLIQRESELASLAGFCRRKILLMEEQGDSESRSIKEKIYTDLFNYQDEYKKLISDCENQFPRYRQLKSESTLPSPSQVCNSLDDSTVLLSYTLTDTALYIMVLDNDHSNLLHVPVDESFKNTVSDYINGIKSFKLDEFGTLSGNLYNKLIKPIEKQIIGKEHLIIIPDKVLLYLPFETLCNDGNIAAGKNFSKPSYLVKRFGISYHFSVDLYYSSLQKITPQKDSPFSFIGLAPVFSKDSINSFIITRHKILLNSMVNDDESLRSVTINGESYNELPFSEKEVEEIVSLFNSKNLHAVGYLHSYANEGIFRKEAGKYSCIHLSTHGLTNETHPDLSGLLFSPPYVSSDSTVNNITTLAPVEDGVLIASDLYALNLSAYLVVLSACESGIGKLIRGEGLISIARGFLFSGVHNIAYSLWKVGDKSTRDLMVRFYSGLLNGNSCTQALKEAKLKMIQSEEYSYPLYWGGFVLIGK